MKSTIRRQKDAADVISAGEVHKKLIADGLAKRMGEDLGPAVELIVERIVADLKDKTEAMVRADDAHDAEIRDDPAARRERDDVSKKLYSLAVDTRKQLGALFGTGFTELLGFKGKMPRDPRAVQSACSMVADRLGEVTPPEPKIPGVKVDLSAWKKPLDELIPKLDAALSRVADEEAQANLTLVEKHRAIDDFDASYAVTAELISSFLKVAGEDFLAKRVKPKRRHTKTPGDNEKT